MSPTNEQLIIVLRGLLDLSRKGEDGFRAAAFNAQDDQLRTLFHNYGYERGQLAAELRHEIRWLGGNPDQPADFRLQATHAWDTQAPTNIQDDAAILAYCECAVETALHEYESALNTALPFRVRQVVSRQNAAIRAAHQRIREIATQHLNVANPSASLDGS